MNAYFTSREAARLVDLTPHRIRAIARLGIIGRSPSGDDERQEQKRLRRCYSFADLTLLRTVQKVLARGLALSRVMRALVTVRAKQVRSPRGLVSTTLASEEGRILAREGDTYWDVETGQALLFAPAQACRQPQGGAQVTAIPRVPREQRCPETLPPQSALEAPEGGVVEADRYFDLARKQESTKPSEAYRLYALALLCDPEHVESLVNLGCLHLAQGELPRAQSYFRVALCLDAGHSIAHYCSGMVAEARAERGLAIQCFRLALLYRPDFADARRALTEALAKR